MLLAAAACRSTPEADASAAAAESAFEIHRQRLQVPLSQKHPILEVINRHGDVRLRPANARIVEVLAVAQRLGERAEIERIEATPTAAGARVTVHYPGNPSDAPVAGGRVDLVIFAPPGTRAVVQGRDGLIAARRFDGSLWARTVDGPIKASLRGSADLATRDGPVTLTLMTPAWGEPARGATRAGEVRVYLPESSHPQLDLATAGEVALPDPWRSRERHRSGRRHHWRDGNPRSTLKVESARGMIVLRTLPE